MVIITELSSELPKNPENPENPKKRSGDSVADVVAPPKKVPRLVCATFWFQPRGASKAYPLLETQIPRDSHLYEITHDPASKSARNSNEPFALDLPARVTMTALTERICGDLFGLLSGLKKAKELSFYQPNARRIQGLCQFWRLKNTLDTLPFCFPACTDTIFVSNRGKHMCTLADTFRACFVTAVRKGGISANVALRIERGDAAHPYVARTSRNVEFRLEKDAPYSVELIGEYEGERLSLVAYKTESSRRNYEVKLNGRKATEFN